MKIVLIHEFVDGNKPIMVLIHGALTPWQIWMPQIMVFKQNYDIYTIALNAHTEEAASEFVSVPAEVEGIVDGAPLIVCPKFAVHIMINNYKSIIRKSKARDKKVIERRGMRCYPEKPPTL